MDNQILSDWLCLLVIYISKVMNEIMGLHQTIFGTDIKTCTWPVDNVQRSVQRQYNPVALTTRSR